VSDQARVHQLRAEARAAREEAEDLRHDDPRRSNPLGPRAARLLMERAESLEAEADKLEREIAESEESADPIS
jgi:hypothetical protein